MDRFKRLDYSRMLDENIYGWLVRSPKLQIDRQINRQIDSQIYRQIDREIDRQIDIYIDRYIHRQIDRQIDRQINKYIMVCDQKINMITAGSIYDKIRC